MASSAARAGSATTVRERRADGALPWFVHPGWSDRFPWLVQGTTGRGDDRDRPFDLCLFGSAAAGTMLERWRMLRERTGLAAAVHARQVHGAEVEWHEGAPAGLVIGDDRDGHATRAPGLLLAVSVADCVPVSIVDPEARAVALLHAGWRGVAADVVAAGVRTLVDRASAEPGRLWVHLGPAICGRCYEVGPEVHRALGLPGPRAPAPVDLRAALASRARALGIRPERISTSAHCTLCGGEGGDPDHARAFFSHRGDDAGRQMALLGIRPHPVGRDARDGRARNGARGGTAA